MDPNFKISAIVNEAKEIFVQNRKLIEELDQLTNARRRRRSNKKESNPAAVILQILLIALVSLLAYRIYAAVFPGFQLLAPLMLFPK